MPMKSVLDCDMVDLRVVELMLRHHAALAFG